MRSALLALAALAGLPASAQAPLVTDRPDLTESPLAVPLGRVQLETGATLVRASGATTLCAPEALVRWSPAPRIELRLALPDATLGTDGVAAGALGAGGKAELGTLAGTDVAAIAMLGVPLGGGRLVPEMILTAGRDVAFGALGAQVAATWEGASPTLGATLVAARELGARVGAFVELAVESVWSETPAVLLHHGYTLALGADAQADLHVGAGLSGGAPAALVGLGWSRRW